MRYGNHEFIPNGNFNKRKFKSLANLNLRSHTELKMWDDYFARAYKEEANVNYNYHEFYAAMEDSDADMFLCDNGKVYVPCEHELMEFVGYR